MASIKPRKTERKNQMHYCELKDNKTNAVALIHMFIYLFYTQLWLAFHHITKNF